MVALPSWVKSFVRCPACGGLLDDAGGLTCTVCGQFYPLSPVPLLVTEPKRSARWGTEMSEELLEQRRLMFREKRWIGDQMIDHLAPGTVVLSVAEGYGEIAFRLAERHPHLNFIASDFSEDRIAGDVATQKRLGLENVWCCVADAGQLPFADGSFTVGYARGLLQIFNDPTPVITELRRVLRERLLVDQLGNRPFLVLWFWLFQRVENVRARLQGREPHRSIWNDVKETLPKLGVYWPLWRYRRWFKDARSRRVLANCVFVWETGRHHRWLGWLGYGGALDVEF